MYSSIEVEIGIVVLAIISIILGTGFCLRKDCSSKNLKFWIIALLVIFIIISITLFIIYQNSHPNDTIWGQIWGSLESQSFKVLAASVVIPILILLFENIFKVRERVEKERLSKQTECIGQIQNMWVDLTNLTSKVMYFEINDNKTKDIEDIIQKLEEFSISAGETATSLQFDFSSHLSDEDIDSLLSPLNFLYFTTKSVAQYIHKFYETQDEIEIEKLQKYLRVIEEGFYALFQEATINILKDYIIMDSGTSKEKKDAKIDIERIEKQIKVFNTKLNILRRKHNKFLQYVDGSEVDNLRKFSKEICKDLQKWLSKNEDKNVFEYPKIDKFRSYYFEIPIEKRLEVEIIPYSTDFIRELANFLDYILVSFALESKSKAN